jgi:uncharacterized protein DUF2568
MDILKALNLVIRFLLELCMLAAFGDWGFKTGSGWALKIIFGIGLPVLIAILWWLAWRLRGISRLTLELTLLGSGAIALFASGRQDLAWLYTIVLVVNKLLMIVWKQQSELF